MELAIRRVRISERIAENRIDDARPTGSPSSARLP
jgi:hypothetical protein